MRFYFLFDGLLNISKVKHHLSPPPFNRQLVFFVFVEITECHLQKIKWEASGTLGFLRGFKSFDSMSQKLKKRLDRQTDRQVDGLIHLQSEESRGQTDR